MLRPGGPVYTLMSARELRRFPLFAAIGAFGMDAERPASVLTAVRFLRTRVCERPDATVIFFPQGRIWPSHRRPLGFRRGIEVFARQIAPCVVLPVAIHHEPLGASAPTIFVSAGQPIAVTGRDLDHHALEAAVEMESDRILDFLSRHGEDAARHWPGPFDRIASPSISTHAPAGR